MMKECNEIKESFNERTPAKNIHAIGFEITQLRLMWVCSKCHDELSTFFNPDNKTELLKLLSETGVVQNTQTCKHCVCYMNLDQRCEMHTW